MKILKYILGILAILALGFVLIGYIMPTVEYDCEIEVDKPLAEAWAFAQDEEKLGEWLTGLQKIEHINGTPGTVGAVSDVHFDANGEMTTIRETITEIKPDESISMTYESEFMDMDYTMAMSDSNGKTKINSSTVTKGNSFFSRSLMALMGGSIKQQEKTNLAKLKAAIERNTKNYFPEPEPESIEEKVIE